MKGRFAPSPTGYMHLGNIWVALLSYWSARQQNGSYIVRLEDIDTQRSKPIYGEAILEDLSWLGITWDEEPLYQSSRIPLYESYLEELKEKELVYPCCCNRSRLQQIGGAPHSDEGRPVYDGYCLLHGIENATRPPSWRFSMKHREGHFHDRFRGSVDYAVKEHCDDIILKRWDGMMAYHLAVVVDDERMGVTEVIRGCDLLGVTGHQREIGKALNFRTLTYGHVPMLVDDEGYRLSKRQKSITIRDMRAKGYKANQIWGYLGFVTGILSEEELSRSGEIPLEELIKKEIPLSIMGKESIILTNFDIMVS